MRLPALLLGIALLAGGAIVLLKGGYITTRRQVLEVGGLSVTAQQRSEVAPWIAGIALVAGTALVIVGLSSRRS